MENWIRPMLAGLIWVITVALLVFISIEPWRRRGEINQNRGRGKLPDAAYDPSSIWGVPAIVIMAPVLPLIGSRDASFRYVPYHWDAAVVVVLAAIMIAIQLYNRHALLSVLRE